MLAPPGALDPEHLVKFYAEGRKMNYALVQSGVVINVIDWDGVAPYTSPDDCKLHLVEGPVDIGWLWVDGAPVDPNPPVHEPKPAEPPSDGGPVVL